MGAFDFGAVSRNQHFDGITNMDAVEKYTSQAIEIIEDFLKSAGFVRINGEWVSAGDAEADARNWGRGRYVSKQAQ